MPESTKKNIYQRINAVMQEVTYIQKEQKQGMRYSVVSHDAVTSKLHDSIVKNGIVYYPVATRHLQNGNRTEAVMVIRFVNIDNPEDYVNVETFGYGIDDQDKGPGKAMSYAVKYALLKTFGLETGDDPDNDQGVVHRPAEKQPDPDTLVSEFTVAKKEILTSAAGKEYAVMETDKGKVIAFSNSMAAFQESGTYRAAGRVENKDGKHVFIVSNIEQER